jgi:hypothetical protein
LGKQKVTKTNESIVTRLRRVKLVTRLRRDFLNYQMNQIN